ncbi:MAG: DNA mismatch repair protein MutS [Chloroflexi bacterium]|nr:DNA mismatch repair protein MutS [Chloroflexota bacterium]
MTFHSILYPETKGSTRQEALEAPAFFVDLNLDQVVDAITAGRQEYDLRPFFYTSLHDMGAIKYRHEIMQDLEDETLLENIRSFAQRMIVMRRYLALAEKLEFRNHKEGWFLEAARVYCEAVTGLAHDLSQAKLHSRGLSAFRSYVTDYANSPGYVSLATETTQVKAGLSAVQYCITIKGLTVRVRNYEAETDYSMEVERTFERFKQGAVKDYRLALHHASGMNHVEAGILDCVAKLYPDVFASLHQFCAGHSHFVDETIRAFDREIQFYVAYLEFIAKFKRAGLPFCYPEITVTREVCDREGFDIALANRLIAERAPVVCNDFHLEGLERVLVVSGPNQGGKTTFARMFGQLHYLASIGCPVPGREARLFLFDRLFTHFEREEDIKNLRGKLQDDLVRICAVLEQSTPDSILIMNEIFSSTTLQDAVFLSRKIMERIIALDLLCVWVTFVDELASFCEKTVSMVSTVVPENPALRTYKILRKPADGLAYALAIAHKNRVTYEHIMERIKP